MTERDRIAEEVRAKLLAGEEGKVTELGSFSVRVYKAYEGRNPRTGETVSVPEKRLPFLILDPALRAHLSGDGPAPTPPWLAALVAELAYGRYVALGRIGALRLKSKTSWVPGGPNFGVLSFSPSQQLTRALAGEPTASQLDRAVLDAALAALPAKPPRTKAALATALAGRGLDHAFVHDGTRWHVTAKKVVDLEDDRKEAPFAEWAGDALLVAAVRRAAGDALLAATDADVVFARLSVTTLFRVSDLPF